MDICYVLISLLPELSKYHLILCTSLVVVHSSTTLIVNVINSTSTADQSLSFLSVCIEYIMCLSILYRYFSRPANVMLVQADLSSVV